LNIPGEFSPPRVDILGIGVSAVDPESAIAEMARWIKEDERHYVCVTGVHGIMESQDDPALIDIHNRSGLTVPDGMPTVWAGHYAGFKSMQRVYGPDLMPSFIAAGVSTGFRHFLYGGAEGVADLLANKLRQKFPGVEIVGTYCPPFRPLTEQEEVEVAELINASGADVVWVGLSTPKQERWMDRMTDRLDVNVVLGVGAAFDINAELASRAPRWMQRIGMEWLYRLIKEPRRLAKRYLKNNPRFLWRILWRRPRPMA
jgi:N-acetylglucosaminyldiphosphoundecaprenol N-acetyl-beta-D-mannosaminyltransferase